MGSRRVPNRALHGHDEPERTSLARDRLGADRPTVQLHELLAEREPEPGALRLSAGRAVDLSERLKQRRFRWKRT